MSFGRASRMTSPGSGFGFGAGAAFALGFASGRALPTELFQAEAVPPRRNVSISSAVAVRPFFPKPSTSLPVFASFRPNLP